MRALIPFGAAAVWGSIEGWLLFQGEVGAGIGLLLWRVLVVSWIDNLVRPWIISGVAHSPFLLVMFGGLGVGREERAAPSRLICRKAARPSKL